MVTTTAYGVTLQIIHRRQIYKGGVFSNIDKLGWSLTCIAIVKISITKSRTTAVF